MNRDMESATQSDSVEGNLNDDVSDEETEEKPKKKKWFFWK